MSIDTSQTGLYEVTYTATDESGNTSSIVRTVTISSLAVDPISSTVSCGNDTASQTPECPQEVPQDAPLNCPVEPGENPLETVCIPCGSRIYGCTDKTALNYNPRATNDDGSCVFLQKPTIAYQDLSIPVNSSFTLLPEIAGGSYQNIYVSPGTPIPIWLKFDSSTGRFSGEAPASFNSFAVSVVILNSVGSNTGSFTVFPIYPQRIDGCTNKRAQNYNPLATHDDGSCLIVGCRNPEAPNYDPEATVDGYCIKYGCTSPNADNWDQAANTDDGSCIFCKNPYIKIDPINWDGEGVLTITGSAKNTTAVLVTINGVTKTVLVTTLGNWVSVFSQEEISEFPFGVLSVLVMSSDKCQDGQFAEYSREIEKKEPFEPPLPYCQDRVIVIQVCNANAVIDDNYNLLLNGQQIAFLNLNYNQQVGSVVIFDPSAVLSNPDFECPLDKMVIYRASQSLFKKANTLQMVNVQQNQHGNYGTVQIRNYLKTYDNRLISPCVIANLEYNGGDGSSFSFNFPYESCCPGDIST